MKRAYLKLRGMNDLLGVMENGNNNNPANQPTSTTGGPASVLGGGNSNSNSTNAGPTASRIAANLPALASWGEQLRAPFRDNPSSGSGTSSSSTDANATNPTETTTVDLLSGSPVKDSAITPQSSYLDNPSAAAPPPPQGHAQGQAQARGQGQYRDNDNNLLDPSQAPPSLDGANTNVNATTDETAPDLFSASPPKSSQTVPSVAGVAAPADPFSPQPHHDPFAAQQSLVPPPSQTPRGQLVDPFTPQQTMPTRTTATATATSVPATDILSPPNSQQAAVGSFTPRPTATAMSVATGTATTPHHDPFSPQPLATPSTLSTTELPSPSQTMERAGSNQQPGDSFSQLNVTNVASNVPMSSASNDTIANAAPLNETTGAPAQPQAPVAAADVPKASETNDVRGSAKELPGSGGGGAAAAAATATQQPKPMETTGTEEGHQRPEPQQQKQQKSSQSATPAAADATMPIKEVPQKSSSAAEGNAAAAAAASSTTAVPKTESVVGRAPEPLPQHASKPSEPPLQSQESPTEMNKETAAAATENEHESNTGNSKNDQQTVGGEVTPAQAEVEEKESRTRIQHKIQSSSDDTQKNLAAPKSEPVSGQRVPATSSAAVTVSDGKDGRDDTSKQLDTNDEQSEAKDVAAKSVVMEVGSKQESDTDKVPDDETENSKKDAAARKEDSTAVTIQDQPTKTNAETQKKAEKLEINQPEAPTSAATQKQAQLETNNTAAAQPKTAADEKTLNKTVAGREKIDGQDGSPAAATDETNVCSEAKPTTVGSAQSANESIPTTTVQVKDTGNEQKSPGPATGVGSADGPKQIEQHSKVANDSTNSKSQTDVQMSISTEGSMDATKTQQAAPPKEQPKSNDNPTSSTRNVPAAVGKNDGQSQQAATSNPPPPINESASSQQRSLPKETGPQPVPKSTKQPVPQKKSQAENQSTKTTSAAAVVEEQKVSSAGRVAQKKPQVQPGPQSNPRSAQNNKRIQQKTGGQGQKHQTQPQKLQGNKKNDAANSQQSVSQPAKKQIVPPSNHVAQQQQQQQQPQQQQGQETASSTSISAKEFEAREREAREAMEREAKAKEREAEAMQREAKAREQETQAKERESQAKQREAKALERVKFLEKELHSAHSLVMQLQTSQAEDEKRNQNEKTDLKARLQNQTKLRADAEEKSHKATIYAKKVAKELDKQREESSEILKKVNEQLVQVSNENSSLETEMIKIREERDEQARKEATLTTRLNAYKKKEGSEATALEHYNDQIEFLQKEVRETKEDLESVKEERDKLKQEVAEWKQYAEQRSQQLEKAVNDEKKTNDERKKKMKAFVEAKTEEVRSAKADNMSLYTELDQTNRSLKELNQQYKQLHGQWVQAQTRNRELQRDMNKMKKDSEKMSKVGGTLEAKLSRSAQEKEDHKNKRLAAKNELMAVLGQLEAERDVNNRIRESIKVTFTPKALSQQQTIQETLDDFEGALQKLAGRLRQQLAPPPVSGSDLLVDMMSEQTMDDDNDDETSRSDADGGSSVGSGSVGILGRQPYSEAATTHVLNKLEKETQRVSQCILAFTTSVERMHELLDSTANSGGCIGALQNMLVSRRGVGVGASGVGGSGNSPAEQTAMQGLRRGPRYGQIPSGTIT